VTTGPSVPDEADGPVVTLDVLSALVDSRRGGGDALDALARRRGWPVDGATLYDRWDAANKRAHRECTGWVPFADLATRALREAYANSGLPDTAAEDAPALLASTAAWPLWDDVVDGVAALAARYRVGLLSNIDDALLARMRVWALPLHRPAVVTSERVRAYKPAAALYARAGELLGPFVHVATSARDVRGALEAGVPVVRLRRPGHDPSKDGPAPGLVAEGMAEVPALVARAASPPP
jgi:2-haloacid dehalogenase